MNATDSFRAGFRLGVQRGELTNRQLAEIHPGADQTALAQGNVDGAAGDVWRLNATASR